MSEETSCRILASNSDSIEAIEKYIQETKYLDTTMKSARLIEERNFSTNWVTCREDTVEFAQNELTKMNQDFLKVANASEEPSIWTLMSPQQ